eukprot:Opistho-2@72995
MATSSTTQKLVRQFLQQYYSVLSSNPDTQLHLFYHDNSSLSRANPSELAAETAHGLEAIRAKIQSLGYKDCRINVTTIDYQTSVGDGIVVTVNGELAISSENPRSFMQTFFLARQNPSGYYVHNDMLRFLEDPAVDVADESEAVAEVESAPEAVQHTPEAAPAVAAPVEPEVVQAAPSPRGPAQAPQTHAPAAEPQHQQPAQRAAPSPRVQAAQPAAAPVAAAAHHEPAVLPPPAAVTASELAPVSSQPPVRKSWAGVASTNKEVPQPAPVAERKVPTLQKPVQQQRLAKPAEDPKAARPDAPSARPSVYVKNVPADATEDALHRVFAEAVGGVRSCKVLPAKNPGMPLSAFVDFESAEAVQKAIKHKSVLFNGVTLIVEERREKSSSAPQKRAEGSRRPTSKQ